MTLHDASKEFELDCKVQEDLLGHDAAAPVSVQR